MSNKIPRVGQVVRNKGSDSLFAVIDIENNEGFGSAYMNRTLKLTSLCRLEDKTYSSEDFKEVEGCAFNMRISSEREYKNFIEEYEIYGDVEFKIEEIKSYKISIGQVGEQAIPQKVVKWGDGSVTTPLFESNIE